MNAVVRQLATAYARLGRYTVIRVPRSALENDIVRALQVLDGRAPCHRIIDLVGEWHTAEFSQPYYQETINLERGGVPRWQKEIEFARLLAVREGYLLRPHESGRGIWQLAHIAHVA